MLANTLESDEPSSELTIANSIVSAITASINEEEKYDSQTGIFVPSPEILSSLQEDPAGVVRMLRTAIQERAIVTSDDITPIQGGLEVLLHAIANTLFLPVAQLGSNTWPALLQSGIHDVLLDSILREGFFEQSKVGARLS